MKEKFLNPTELKTKWKVKFVENLLATSNESLLESTLDSQVPDDWDGCWSETGKWEKDKSIEILKDRLKTSGFLNGEA